MRSFLARHLLITIVVVGAVVAAFVVAGMWTTDEPGAIRRGARTDSVRVAEGGDAAGHDLAEPPPNLTTRLRAHVDSLANAGGHASRVVFTEGNRWSVEYVLRQMRRSTRQVSADTFYVKRRGGGMHPLVNATATLPGTSDSLLIICAHIDASASRDAGWSRNWSRMRAPGADDNATGVAAMLETLTLAAHAGTRPRYTVMFVACNAEERNPDYAGLSRRDGHHLGSRHLAAKLKGMGKPIKGVIAMDMVGWNPRETFVYLFASRSGTALARELVARKDYLGLSLGLPSSFSACPNSDNESFDRFGIPAVLFMESCAPWRSDAHHPRNPNYHTSRDLPGGVTYPILDKTTRLVYSFLFGTSEKLKVKG
jgi:Peptidase family M28